MFKRLRCSITKFSFLLTEASNHPWVHRFQMKANHRRPSKHVNPMLWTSVHLPRHRHQIVIPRCPNGSSHSENNYSNVISDSVKNLKKKLSFTVIHFVIAFFFHFEIKTKSKFPYNINWFWFNCNIKIMISVIFFESVFRNCLHDNLDFQWYRYNLCFCFCFCGFIFRLELFTT